MNATIREILRLSGEMPDATAHARYLAGLSPVELLARLDVLKRQDVREQAQEARQRNGAHGVTRPTRRGYAPLPG